MLLACSLEIVRKFTIDIVIIVPLRIDNVLLLVRRILFLYVILFVSLHTNELIEVKEIPVTGEVHELGQTDGTSIGGARRLRNRDLELCSPRGFGGMEYHAWLPERRPLLLGELGIVRSSRRASRSLLVFIRFFLIFRSPLSLLAKASSLLIFSFLYISSPGFCFRSLRFSPPPTDSSRVSLFPN